MSEIGAIRTSYTRARLAEADLAASWSQQLRIWFDEAAGAPGVIEPNAIQVATVSAEGRPAVRTVLARAIEAGGVVFYTNYDSAKGHDLAANPYAAAVFSWLALERQVRLSGRVERVSRAETDAYVAGRPRSSRIASWASPQSQVIASRQVLDDLVVAAEQAFAGAEVPASDHWGGYRLIPDSVEFWQGRASRLHDRLCYRLVGAEWVLERLAP